jgi:methyl-accepting chemotaxis protein
MARGGYANADAGALALPGGGGVAPARTAAMPKMLGLTRLPVAAKAIAVTAVGLIVLTLVLAVTAVSTVERDAKHVAAQRIDTAMLLAWELVLNEGAVFSLDGTEMKADKTVLNGRNQVFDKLRGVGDAVAGIYAGDIPVATMRADSGDRAALGARIDRAAYEVVQRDGKYRGEIEVMGEAYLTAYDPIKDARGQVIGALFVGLSKASLLAGAATVRSQIMLYGTAIAATVLLLSFVTLRRLLAPVALLTAVTRRVVAGETITTVPGVGRRDDIGELARGIHSLAQDVARKRELEAGEEQRRQALEAEKQRAHRYMVDAIETEIDRELPKITALAGQMSGAAGRMVEASHRASDECVTVRDSAALAAQNAHQVATAAEQLSLSIGEIAARVGDAATATASAVGAVDAILARGQQLTEQVGQIGRFSDLITNIANQTNLLALNATIEAARAGVAGKGFAVVATEVKGLASQTAKATEEIRQQIAQIQEVTAAVTGGMAEIRRVIERLDETSTAVASAVEQQRAATGDIARSVGESTSGIGVVSDGITRVASLASAVLEQAEGVESVSQSISTEAGALSDNTKAILRVA